jgi:hypothetical protein
MQRGQATWTCSIDMQRSDMDIKAMASIMDIWGGHLAWTCRMGMQPGHAALTCSMGMQPGHEAWTCRYDMQHGHGHGHAASMYVVMQH